MQIQIHSRSSLFFSSGFCGLPHVSSLRNNYAFPLSHSASRFPKLVAALPPFVQSSIHDLSENRVLSAVVVAVVFGQLLKPFTSALKGKGINWKLAISSGGMPSVHSASVTAASTAIALERGLADSLFGLSLVFAGIVMYDAQGVRRAVGKQAQVINTMILEATPDALPSPKPSNGEPVTELHALEESLKPNERWTMTYGKPSDESNVCEPNFINSDRFFRRRKRLSTVETGEVNPQEFEELDGWQHVPLKESVGHTKIEVAVGGLWGVFCAILLSQLPHQMITMK